MIIGYEVKVIERHLSEAQTRLLEFLKNPKTAAEAAEYMGIEIDSLYPNLRLLQRLDLVEKAGFKPNPTGGPGRIAVFMATGRQPVVEPPYMGISGIKAHDPFGRASA